MAQRTTVYILQIDQFQVQVTRKNIKNMYLRVVGTDPVLQISAPLRVPDDDIVQFVMGRKEWILAGQQRIREEEKRRRERQKEQQNDQQKNRQSNQIEAGSDSENGGSIDEDAQERQRQEEWKKWTYLKEEITKLLEKWAPIMGVKPGGFKLRRMKTRWGSCNVRTHHMTFNLDLAEVPYECLEYVVVHELTHLLEPSHNARFWELMEHYLPGAKQLRTKLREYGK